MIEAVPSCAWHTRATETSVVVGQKLARKRRPCFDVKNSLLTLQWLQLKDKPASLVKPCAYRKMCENTKVTYT